jgi:hypothetical protein
MSNTTFEDYITAIKRQYEVTKLEDKTGLLFNPTPGNLKKLCSNLVEVRTSKSDQEIFMAFFNFESKENRSRQIEKFDADKLRPLEYFMKGRTGVPQQTVLDLIAVLIDFNPRPFREFFKGDGIGPKPKDDDEGGKEAGGMPGKTVVEKGKTNRKFIAILVASALFFGGYALKTELFPSKDCIQWNKDHYEEVVCEGKKIGFANINPIFKKEERLLDFKKIQVDEKTVFFKEGQPVVWYIKQNNKCEFFNGPGLHPISGKPLKPITEYIVQKHVLKKIPDNH